MAGKLCIGVPANNIGAGRIGESRAFCEGLAFRMSGTAVGQPITGNPHESGSPDSRAWDAGWIEADAAAGGTLPITDGPCCAVDRAAVIAA